MGRVLPCFFPKTSLGFACWRPTFLASPRKVGKRRSHLWLAGTLLTPPQQTKTRCAQTLCLLFSLPLVRMCFFSELANGDFPPLSLVAFSIVNKVDLTISERVHNFHEVALMFPQFKKQKNSFLWQNRKLFSL